MSHLRLMVGAGALEGRRWAREHLYSLLVLTPLVLGMTYLGVGRVVEDSDWRPSDEVAAGLAVSAAACLLALGVSRAVAEIYHLRRPESLFDALPVSARAQLAAALVRRAARVSGAAAAAVVARTLAGGGLWDARLPALLACFVAVTASGQALAAVQWVHWGHRRERAHAAVALLMFAACSVAAGLLLFVAVKPWAAPELGRAWLVAGSIALAGATLLLLFALHERWRASDLEYAKR
ncbi:MAG TPA: hypothetical protein VD968_18740, partial [Pyrinomonadaceae bacterium]|nr:hypothetical protein [Pyrinomonadaceae bacterium]